MIRVQAAPPVVADGDWLVIRLSPTNEPTLVGYSDHYAGALGLARSQVRRTRCAVLIVRQAERAALDCLLLPAHSKRYATPDVCDLLGPLGRIAFAVCARPWAYMPLGWRTDPMRRA